MGAQKCCVSHKVVQPSAADAVSLRELPICESVPANDGPAAQAIHPEFPPTPPTQTHGNELSKADDGNVLTKADHGKRKVAPALDVTG